MNGKPAAVNDPRTWTTFETIEPFMTAELLPAICLKGSNLCVVDLDDCFDKEQTKTLTKKASWIVNKLHYPAYKEISRSGSGIHLIFLGVKRDRRCKAGV
jgi:primase-polymerase (primpol)-like protein